VEGSLHIVDWAVVAAYFGAVIAIALVAMRKEGVQDTSAGYFLAGRNVGWIIIGTSLFASNIGSEHLVGLAGTGASSGLAVAHFEVLAALILIVLGWVFVPFYLRSGVFTMPEFLERRYSSGARWYLAVVSILGYVLTKISVTITAGGIVFEAIGVDFWTGALVVVIGTGLYSMLGGLRAVLWTDLLQAIVLIGGALAVTLIGLAELGGWGEMTALAGEGFLDMWKPATDPNFPWTGILFGAPILGIWYWCTDQFIVQRVLAARNIDHARRGTLLAGYLKLLPLFIFVLPGVIAYCMAEQGTLVLEDSNGALPVLITQVLPMGVKGLVIAGLLAALMSSLSSVFNSCSTLVTIDIYQRLRPEASERKLVMVGQVATGVLVVFGLAWIPMMERISSDLFVYLQSVQAYISPPIAAVFLLGVLWSRLNAAGAAISLAVGFVLGMLRLTFELYPHRVSGLMADMVRLNFLHFAAFLFVICAAVLIVVSLATPPPPEEGVMQKEVEPPSATSVSWRKVDGWATLVLLGLVGLIWVVFSG